MAAVLERQDIEHRLVTILCGEHEFDRHAAPQVRQIFESLVDFEQIQTENDNGKFLRKAIR